MFFNSTPNFLYPDFKIPGKYKLSKNIFRRVRARDSFNAIYASSTPYTIQLGETPDSISYSKYKDPSWYWTILILNNILSIEDQWPLANDELERIVEKKYGNLIDKPRYWETSEIKNRDGEVVLQPGVIVEVFQNREDQSAVGYIPTWSYTYIDYIDTDGSAVERTVTGDLNLVEVTNREYEYQLNELKREIYLPRASALPIMEEELKSLLEYDTKYKITKDGFRESEEV